MTTTFIAALAALAGLAVLGVSYIRPAQRIIAKRQQHKPLNHVENCRISGAALRALTYRFGDGEDTVYWADRQHPVVFWQAGGTAITLGCLLGLVGLVTLTHPLGYHYTTIINGHRTRHHVSLWWLWLLCLPLAGLAFGWAWVEWLNWRSTYRLITNQHLTNVCQPWAWAIWLWRNENYDPQPLTSVLAVETHAAIGGRVFDYGTVKVKVPSMEAEDTALEMHYTPDHEDFAKRLENLRAEAKQRDSLAGQA